MFYGIPFLTTFYYAFLNNLAQRKWVGLANFASLLKSDVFGQAAGNTLKFILLSVPTGLLASLFIAILLKKWEKKNRLILFTLLLPLVLPSGTVLAVWKTMFAGGNISEIWSIVIIFLWKNISYNIVLFSAGLHWIPRIYYEQYQLEGASWWNQFSHITWIYIMPTTFTVLLMSVINSFKVFKEIYMLFGAYPKPSIYMLQHYMNNQFITMNMQKLCASADILCLTLGMVLGILFLLQKRVHTF